jgi:hypothetical protein
MKRVSFARSTGTILALLLLTCRADAQAISETLSGINDLIYGIIAGIATLMLIFHALKWKTAESPQDIQKAKKGMITVILGLMVVMIAGTAVDVLYGKKTGGNATDDDYVVKISTSIRLTTTKKPSTTMISTTMSSTTSTSTTIDNYLTAKNLVNRIKDAGGFYITNYIKDVTACPACKNEMNNVFGKEPDGSNAYADLRKWDPPEGHPPCSGMGEVPNWCSGYGQEVANGCNTLSELNTAYGFGLQCKPHYTYYDCDGNVTVCITTTTSTTTTSSTTSTEGATTTTLPGPKLTLLFVPIDSGTYQIDASTFDSYVSMEVTGLLDSTPLVSCTDQAMIKKVAQKCPISISTDFSECLYNQGDDILSGIDACASASGETYDYVIGVAASVVCGNRGFTSAGSPIFLTVSDNPKEVAHELGHSWGLSDEYFDDCRCFPPTSTVNCLTSSLGGGDPYTGYTSDYCAGGSLCAGYGESTCLGHNDAGGGRCIMGTGANDPSSNYCTLCSNRLSSLDMLKC